MDQAIIATIGTFDGVHRGHQALLTELSRLSEQCGLRPAVVTFDPSPSRLLYPDTAPPQLSTGLERVERLRALGYEDIILLAFTRELASLSAREFMTLLRDKYGVRALLIGYDHRFGADAQRQPAFYSSIGQSLGLQVFHAEALDQHGAPISSSRIRALLLEGHLEDANRLLGYPYTLSGRVVGGLQIGRSMGYPTANIVPDDSSKLVPADGVYAVRIRLEPRLGTADSAPTYHCGMLYIGDRPTIDEGLSRTIEVNIFDLSANLYAQRLRIEFARYIRGNERFPSLEALQAQIARDERAIRKLFDLE